MQFAHLTFHVPKNAWFYDQPEGPQVFRGAWMRRRTKVTIIIVIAIVTIIHVLAAASRPGGKGERSLVEAIHFDGLAAWPSESLIERLTQVRTADEAVDLIGRRPDFVIPPNTGAKKGVEQWVWTKNHNTKAGPFSSEPGWINVFVSRDNFVLESDCDQSLSLFASLKETGRDVLEKAINPLPYPTPPPVDPDQFLDAPVMNLGKHTLVLSSQWNSPDEQGAASQKTPIALRQPCKVGDIKIIGNDSTLDRIILRLVGISRLQTLTENDLAAAEAALVDSGLFMIDEKNGIRPNVIVVDPEGPSESKDVLVQICERFRRR